MIRRRRQEPGTIIIIPIGSMDEQPCIEVESNLVRSVEKKSGTSLLGFHVPILSKETDGTNCDL